MIQKTLLILFILFSQAMSSTINIAGSSNINTVINILIIKFNSTHVNTKINVTISSSGKLTSQIINGAPYDIFLSANTYYPNILFKKNLTLTKPKVYAQGSLVYFSTKKRNFNNGLNILENKKINTIAIANPKTAPYGQATLEVLKNSGLYDKIYKKLVYAQSISQTVSYALNVANIAFISKSILYSKQMQKFKKFENWNDVDKKLYNPINQAVVLLTHAKHNQDAKEFYDFIFSNDAKQILKEYGYN